MVRKKIRKVRERTLCCSCERRFAFVIQSFEEDGKAFPLCFSCLIELPKTSIVTIVVQP